MSLVKCVFCSLILLQACSGAHKNESIIAEGAVLTLLSDQFSFTEGPASDQEGNVYFTDQPNDKIYRWSPDEGITLFLDSSGRSNGLYVDHEGFLLTCADQDNELWRLDENKLPTILVKGFQGKKLNGPNDLWLAANGGIYFTDPFYKRPYWIDTLMRQSNQSVFYLAPGDSIPQVVDSTLVQPNGIVGTSDNKLYVADIQGSKIYRYRIEPNGMLSQKEAFAAMGSDGMTLDEQGNLYLTGDGVTVFDALGVQIHHMPIPDKWTANVTFGGKNHDVLFITSSESVYTLQMNVKGARW